MYVAAYSSNFTTYIRMYANKAYAIITINAEFNSDSSQAYVQTRDVFLRMEKFRLEHASKNIICDPV